jgi:hypothetical protein
VAEGQLGGIIGAEEEETEVEAPDALTEYEEALKYAPNWKQLKESREAEGVNLAA